MRNVIPIVALALSACGGGGNPASMGLSESDPRAVRLERIVDSSDTLLMSAVYQHFTLSSPSGTNSEREITDVICQGTRCENQDGEVYYLHDLFDTTTDIDVQLTSAEVGSRRGFDTVYGEASTASQFNDLSDVVPGTTFKYSTSGEIFGLWGDYGFAATIVTDTPFSGVVLGERFSGDYDSATGFVIGEKSGTSPGGTGSATWNGIAEAVSTTTFRNRSGTAQQSKLRTCLGRS